MLRSSCAVILTTLLATSSAFAQETVDIGVIKDSERRVVQKLLFPKEGRTELGFHLGVMPFDAYLVTPNLQVSFDIHLSESLSISTIVGGGYGLKNGTYAELESPTYGVAPDAYRYLASVLAGVQYSPIYAKMNLNGARVVHFDVYGAARGGVTLEQSVIPAGGIAVAPTVSLVIGTRFFWGERYAIRVEIRDDALIERRKLTSSTHFKQNANLTVGFSMLSPVKGKRK
jgi:outer membrane beta-barrel protein